MSRLLRVWWKMSTLAMQTMFESLLSFVLFVTAKLMRFALLFFTMSVIVRSTSSIAGFSSQEVLLLFFVFTLVDTASQLLFREVYRFTPRVLSGEFDLDLLRPLPSLLRPLLGGPDPFDMCMLFLFGGGFVYYLHASNLVPTVVSAAIFAILLLNALIISASFHILVLSLGILHTQVDHTIMIYRDIWSMGRFPAQIYSGVVGVVLRYVVPVSLMVTLVTEAILGKVGVLSVLGACLLGLGFFLLSLRIWQHTLKHYVGGRN